MHADWLQNSVFRVPAETPRGWGRVQCRAAECSVQQDEQLPLHNDMEAPMVECNGVQCGTAP